MECLELKSITIPYEDFKEMMDYKSRYENFIMDLEYLISDSELDYYKNDLKIGGTVRQFAKKYCATSYSNKLRRLNDERENSKEGEQ